MSTESSEALNGPMSREHRLEAPFHHSITLLHKKITYTVQNTLCFLYTTLNVFSKKVV